MCSLSPIPRLRVDWKGTGDDGNWVPIQGIVTSCVIRTTCLPLCFWFLRGRIGIAHKLQMKSCMWKDLWKTIRARKRLHDKVENRHNLCVLIRETKATANRKVCDCLHRFPHLLLCTSGGVCFWMHLCTHRLHIVPNHKFFSICVCMCVWMAMRNLCVFT